MLWPIYISTLCLLVANAQPLSCQEDAHCSEGYFCETRANVCRECLQCEELQRQPPQQEVSHECIKTVDTCGPCVMGFTNIYGNGIKGKCVLPALFEFGRGPHYAYVCVSAAIAGLLIVAAFMYVIKHTDVFRVVAYYRPMSTNLLHAEIPDMTSPRYLLKDLLRFEDAGKEISKST
ncbi:hypothetical protein PYW07_015915 [Mythimna separata]|uniref:TNFR-Cys domain-containing protein n=1 Tax=Mythimna separata TaxID=271217 RepID=A0AAD7YSS5_MYTSE|nr:hypothetical protein PYW07_015915 [Mythimna separata]